MKNIFVSSTFKDFQYERDWLRNRVLPLLNREAQKYGDKVQFCDLRWGIDTSTCSEEERDSKILSVCLNEIDRTIPYAVILLGDRYGYISKDMGAISRVVKTRGDEFEKQLSSLEISVTQLEIEYLLYRNTPQAEKVFVYFREIENGTFGEDNEDQKSRAIKQEKLENLKKRLKTIFGDRIKIYNAEIRGDRPDCEETFVQFVTQDILSVLQKEWKESETLLPYEKEYEYHLNYWNWRRYGYINTAEIPHILFLIAEAADIVKHEKDILYREALFAQVCMDFQQNGWKVIPMFCGKTELSGSENDIVRYIVVNIEKMLNIPHEEKRTLDEVFEICEQRRQQILIALSGVEKLEKIQEGKKSLYLPEQKFSYVKYYITGDFEKRKDLLNEYAANGFERIITSGRKTEEWLEKSFASLGKEIAKEVKIKFVEKTKDWEAIYEQLAIKHLLILSREDFEKIEKNKNARENADESKTQEDIAMKAIREYQCHVIENIIPQEQKLICSVYMEAIIHQLQAPWLMDVVKYMAISQNGLCIEDFEKLLKQRREKFEYLTFISLMYFENGIFEEHLQGYFSFANEIIREAFLYGMSTKERYAYAAEIYKYLESISEKDMLKEREQKNAKNIGYQIFFCNKIIINVKQDSEEDKKIVVQEMADWILYKDEDNMIWFQKAVRHFLNYVEAYSNVYYLAYFYVFYICGKDIMSENYDWLLREGHNFVYTAAKRYHTQEMWFLSLEFAIYNELYYEKCQQFEAANAYYHLAVGHMEKCMEMLENGKRVELYQNVLREAGERLKKN